MTCWEDKRFSFSFLRDLRKHGSETIYLIDIYILNLSLQKTTTIDDENESHGLFECFFFFLHICCTRFSFVISSFLSCHVSCSNEWVGFLFCFAKRYCQKFLCSIEMNDQKEKKRFHIDRWVILSSKIYCRFSFSSSSLHRE